MQRIQISLGLVVEFLFRFLEHLRPTVDTPWMYPNNLPNESVSGSANDSRLSENSMWSGKLKIIKVWRFWLTPRQNTPFCRCNKICQLLKLSPTHRSECISAIHEASF